MESKSNFDYTFKQCSNGHYYQGEECPYCKSQDNLEDIPDGVKHIVKLCPNKHCFEQDLQYCPYCGETEEVSHNFGNGTIFPTSIYMIFDKKCTVKIDGWPAVETMLLDVKFLGGAYRSHYRIMGLPLFNYKSTIIVGNRKFTGKEFINMIDILADIKGIEIQHE